MFQKIESNFLQLNANHETVILSVGETFTGTLNFIDSFFRVWSYFDKLFLSEVVSLEELAVFSVHVTSFL